MVIIRNISQVLKYEQSKNESKYQEMLTGTLSHELLTPLNSIISISALMHNRGERNIKLTDEMWKELLQYFRIIYNSAMIM